MAKEKLTPADLDARLKFILGITLGSILFLTAVGIIYGLLFVTQPIGAQSENDKMFFNVLGSIATFITGTLAGQIVMEGYLKIRINPWLRRLITRLIAIVPAILVITIYGVDKLDTLLILSQVILSVQLGFAVIPLIHFVSDKETMGVFAIKPFTKIISWLVAIILIYLKTILHLNLLRVIFVIMTPV